MTTTFWTGFAKQAALRAGVETKVQQNRVKNKLERSHGLIVYHGLGSGKTLTSLNATQGMNTDVVVPAALRANYAQETKKFTTGHNPHIMSYEQASKGKASPGAQALVVDEAHALSSMDSQRTRAMLERAKSYPNRLLLTGTPIKNRPSEIAPLLAIARGDKKVPLDPKEFDKKFVETRVNDPGFLSRLILRRKAGTSYHIKNKGEFARLAKGYVDFHPTDKKGFPSVSHEVVKIPFSSEQNHYYQYMMGKANPMLRYKIKHMLPASKAETAQMNSFLSGTRQISNTTMGFGGLKPSPKIMTAVQRLKKREEKDKNFRGVVYSNYLGSGVNAYANELKHAGIPHTVFSGALNDQERKQAVEDYNKGKLRVLLLSGAGAQGLNLKGTKLIQLLEPNWNDVKLEQAIGRGVRFQSHEHLPENERHVHVERYQSTLPPTFMQRFLHKKPDASVDEYLDNMSKEKAKLNEQFLSVLRRVGQKN